MKYIFILNRYSLKKKLDFYFNKIKSYCDSINLNYKIEVNNKNESTEDLVKKYKDKKVCIVACGGDGMINRVINSLDYSNNYFSFIPLGTGNDFYRTNVDEMHDGKSVIDIIKINDRYFINVACFGLDADIANDEKIVHNKFIPKNLRYDVSVLKHFILYKGIKRTYSYDNFEITDKYATIVVCNGRYYGGGYNIAPTALLNDGLLDVYVIKDMNKFKIAKVLLKVKKGGHIHENGVEMFRTSKITIKADKEIQANLDGEIYSEYKYDIEVLPNKLKFIYDSTMIDNIVKNK